MIGTRTCYFFVALPLLSSKAVASHFQSDLRLGLTGIFFDACGTECLIGKQQQLSKDSLDVAYSGICENGDQVTIKFLAPQNSDQLEHERQKGNFICSEKIYLEGLNLDTIVSLRMTDIPRIITEETEPMTDMSENSDENKIVEDWPEIFINTADQTDAMSTLTEPDMSEDSYEEILVKDSDSEYTYDEDSEYTYDEDSEYTYDEDSEYTYDEDSEYTYEPVKDSKQH